MLPKTHILLGGIFALVLYFLFEISPLSAALIFLASFLIDFDHYMWFVQKNKTFSLNSAYNYLKKTKLKKQVLMIFHTVEFHILVFLLGFLWPGFWFILMGMIFHSILDLISLTYEMQLWHREFSLTRYFIIKMKDKNHYF